MRGRKAGKGGIAVGIAAALLLGGLIMSLPKSERNGIFSWKSDAVSQESDALFSRMKEWNISSLYQAFSGKLEAERVQAFLKEAKRQGIDVYYLTGEPQWALEEDGRHLCMEVERAAALAGKEKALAGIMFDVEPYLLEEWDEDSRMVMDLWVKGIKRAYQSCKAYDLELLVCIPFFYDSKGLEGQLEELVRDCCDGIAVMNYYKGCEIEHIETEARLADRYQKALISVYELKAPGTHGITQNNTYWEEGMAAVKSNFSEMKRAYPGQELSMGLHDYEALKELLKDE